MGEIENGGRVVPIKTIDCPHCKVPMKWFHTQMKHGELCARVVVSFMCMNCHLIETRTAPIR